MTDLCTGIANSFKLSHTLIVCRFTEQYPCYVKLTNVFLRNSVTSNEYTKSKETFNWSFRMDNFIMSCECRKL